MDQVGCRAEEELHRVRMDLHHRGGRLQFRALPRLLAARHWRSRSLPSDRALAHRRSQSGIAAISPSAAPAKITVDVATLARSPCASRRSRPRQPFTRAGFDDMTEASVTAPPNCSMTDRSRSHSQTTTATRLSRARSALMATWPICHPELPAAVTAGRRGHRGAFAFSCSRSQVYLRRCPCGAYRTGACFRGHRSAPSLHVTPRIGLTSLSRPAPIIWIPDSWNLHSMLVSSESTMQVSPGAKPSRRLLESMRGRLCVAA